jgi:hypothetical protein
MAGAPLRPVAAALTGVGLRTTAYDHRLVMHATRVALAYLKVHGVPATAPTANPAVRGTEIHRDLI